MTTEEQGTPAEKVEITCPQCSTVSELKGGEHTFCPECDFPLFWADPAKSAVPPAVQSAVVGEEAVHNESAAAGEDDLDAQATDIICRNCALRNPGDRTYCMRCGHELPPPEEWFNPGEPVQVEAEPERPLWRSLVVPFFALIIVAAATLAVLHFGFQVFSSNPSVAITTIQSDDLVTGQIAIVMEGNPPVPVVSYYNAANGSLNVIVCSNPECTSVSTRTTVDTEGMPGQAGMAMAFISGGQVIIYRREATSSLIAVECGSVECDNRTGARGFIAIDEMGDTGYMPVIAVTGGVPVTVYADSEGALRLAYVCRQGCSEADGVINNRSLPGKTAPGAPISLVIPRAGSPYIAYQDPDAGALRLIHCLDVTCESTANSVPVELVSGNFGPQTAMVIDGTTLAPVIAFRDGGDDNNGDLRLLMCGDPDCTPGERGGLAFIDRGARGTADHDVGYDIAMTRGPDGLPIIAYRDETLGELLVAFCTASPCTRDTVVIKTVDNGGEGAGKVKVGYGTSIAVSGDTLVIAYSDADKTKLKVARVDISRLKSEAVIPAASPEPTQSSVEPLP